MRIRRSAIGIFVFWALTLALVAAINLYVVRHPMYRSQAAEVDRTYGTFEREVERGIDEGSPLTVILGNSYVAASLITQGDFEENTCHLSVGGLTLDSVLQVVEHLPEEAPVRLLVVGLGYDYATPIPVGARVYRRYWAGNPLSRLWYTLPLIRAGDTMSDMVYYTLTTPWRGKPDAGGRDEQRVEEEEAPYGSEAHARYIRRSTSDRLTEYRPYTSRVGPEFGRLLDRLSGLCEERDIELFTFTAPVYHGVREGLDPRFLEAFADTIATSGVATVDLNSLFPDWDESYFQDATHPGPRGRRLIRKTLREILLGRAEAESPDLPPPSLW